jgi:hypothetical protein
MAYDPSYRPTRQNYNQQCRNTGFTNTGLNQTSNTFRSSLTKAAAYTTGIIVACASLYSLTEFSQKAIDYVDTKQAQKRFLHELEQDPRFENGYNITKFCFDKVYGGLQNERK